MEGENAVIVLGPQEVRFGGGQFQTNAGGHESSDEIEEEAGDKVLDADDFVIGTKPEKVFPMPFGFRWGSFGFDGSACHIKGLRSNLATDVRRLKDVADDGNLGNGASLVRRRSPRGDVPILGMSG